MSIINSNDDIKKSSIIEHNFKDLSISVVQCFVILYLET